MKIAVLGWGSLVWDSGDLRIKDGKWYRGGPSLPIELSRRSSGRGHLTYVIDERHTRRVPTRYAISRHTDLEDAICDLACREGCKATKIGYVTNADKTGHRARPGVPWQDIQRWTESQKLDAVIWTDLEYEFPGSWTVANAIKYWKTDIPAQNLAEAAKYASSAPPEVDTDLRRQLITEGLIAKHGAVELADARSKESKAQSG